MRKSSRACPGILECVGTAAGRRGHLTLLPQLLQEHYASGVFRLISMAGSSVAWAGMSI